jgi:hypothetical protein
MFNSRFYTNGKRQMAYEQSVQNRDQHAQDANAC